MLDTEYSAIPPGRRPVNPLSSTQAATSQRAVPSGLWMQRTVQGITPVTPASNKQDQVEPRYESAKDFKDPRLPTCMPRGGSPRRVSTRFDLQTNNSKRESSAASATSKGPGLSGLWMNQPVQSASPATFDSINNDQDAVTSESSAEFQHSTLPTLTSGHVTFRTRLDLQTNNSRREVVWSGGSEPAAASSVVEGSVGDDYEIVSDLTEPISLENTSAVAKGADAMVKNSLSRPTEIIDTSKLVEEGKVSTEYIDEPEIFEEQDRAMIDEYEKTFAYARRLRALLNMKFRELDKGTVETNFLLIKAHEHPTQRMIDRWRNVDHGVSYNDQVKRQKQIEDYKANAVKKKGKKGDEQEPVYPDLIRFTVRFRQENSEKRWKDYMSFRKKQKKLGGKKSAGPVPKPNDKYVFAFQDIWSYCVVVYVKPSACLRDIIDPVFVRVGLERRADFTYTIGCFNNDKRAGKAKIIGVPNLPEPVDIHELASELYKKNCTEIYVNDNRCEMFGIFPTYYNPALANKPDEKKDKKKKKGKDKGGKNKSNASAPTTNSAANSNPNNDDKQLEPESVEETNLASLSTPGSATRMLRYEAEVFETAPASPLSASRRRRLNIVEETSKDSSADSGSM